jgi:hypothetical protein
VLRIKVNGAQTNFVAKPRRDGGWDLRCVDFRLRPEDALHLWSEEAGEWLCASEMDLTELAVAEAEKGITCLLGQTRSSTPEARIVVGSF